MFDVATDFPNPAPTGARRSRGSAARGALVPLRGFPCPVSASPQHRPAARRIARRALAARDFLQRVLGVAPRLSLRVLDRADWHRHAEVAAYGVTHVSQAGDLIVGAVAADEWRVVSDYFACRLHPRELAQLIAVHGLDATGRRGPALDEVAESLVVHDVAHLLAAQQTVAFPRRWLAEAFANYALVAVLGDTDPAGLRRLGSLAEAAVYLGGGMPTLVEFERHFGQLNVVASVLAELAITRATYSAYATHHIQPLAGLFDAFRNAPPRDADHEFGRMMAPHVHPAIAAIPSHFAASRTRGAVFNSQLSGSIQ
jgi:hypothetical protein